MSFLVNWMCCMPCFCPPGGSTSGASNSKYDQSLIDDAEIAQLVTSVRHLVQLVPNTICKRLLAEIRKEFDQGKLPPFIIQLDGLQNDPQFLHSCIGVVQPVMAQCNLVILGAKPLPDIDNSPNAVSGSGIIEWTIVSLHTVNATGSASALPGNRKSSETLSNAAASYTSAQKRGVNTASAKKQ